MARIYYYTDGTAADSVSGNGTLTGTPFDTARTGVFQRSRITTAGAGTRDDVFDAMRDALVAAGWTENNNPTSSNTNDSIFSSDGESGDEVINIRIESTDVSTTTNIQFSIGTKLGSSGNAIHGGIGQTGSTGTLGKWAWANCNDGTYDYQILATKDFMWAHFTNGTDYWNAFLGLMRREGCGCNANYMRSTGSTAAGDFVTVDTTGYNPITAGYKVGDTMQIVDVVNNTTAVAERQIVVGLTSSSVTFRKLANSYGTGAFLGALALPLGRMVARNEGLDGPSHNFCSPYTNFGITDNDLLSSTTAAGTARYDAHYCIKGNNGATTDHQNDGEFGDGSGGNNRTLRATCRGIKIMADNLVLAGDNEGSIGRVPGILAWPDATGFTMAPNDTAIADRVSGTPEYVGLVMDPSLTPDSTYLLGPTPGA